LDTVKYITDEASELQPACTLNIDLARIVRYSEKDRGWGLTATMCRTSLKLVVTLDWDVIHARLKHYGVVMSSADVEY
jgi:hypothetical protein